MSPGLNILEQLITNGLTVIQNNLSTWIMVFVLMGYLSKYWYDVGFYRSLYKPISKASEIEYWLSHALWGITYAWGIAFLLIISRTIYAIWVKYDEKQAALILASVLILVAIALLPFISVVVGWWNSCRIKCKNNEIRIILFSGESIPAISVYADDGTFLYYVNLDKTWSSIRKNDVASIRQIR